MGVRLAIKCRSLLIFKQTYVFRNLVSQTCPFNFAFPPNFRLRIASEGWQMRCAMRFFAELGIRYQHVDGNAFTWAMFDAESNL